MKKIFVKLFSVILTVALVFCGFGVMASATTPAAPNAEPAPENFYTEMNTVAGTLTVNWDGTYARNWETTVAVYENDASEPAFNSTFPAGTSTAEITYDTATVKKLRIDVSYKVNDERKSAVASKTIDMSVANAVQLVCEDVTASAQAEFTYNLSGVSSEPIRAILTLNGIENEVQLTGNDSFTVNLENNENQLSLRWASDDYTAFVVGKEIYSDRSSPKLIIPDVTGTVKTDESTYEIAGIVDPGCKVTVNGTAVTPDKDGLFFMEVSLVVGENVFEVVATGANGNGTKETVVVEWIEAGVVSSNVILQYIPLAVAVIFALVLLLFALKERKKYRTLRDEKNLRTARFATLKDLSVFTAVLSGIATVFSVVMLILTIRKISAEFADIALKDVIEAYTLLQNRTLFIILTVVFAVVTALMIVLRAVLLPKLEKKPGKPKKEKAPKKPKAPKAPKNPPMMFTPQVPVTPQAPATQQNPAVTQAQPNAQSENKEAPAEEECFCAYCGTKNKTSTNFCKKCGKPIKK